MKLQYIPLLAFSALLADPVAAQWFKKSSTPENETPSAASVADELPTPSLAQVFEAAAPPTKKTIDEITVHSVALRDFENVLGSSDADWLLYATASNETCKHCPLYDKIFNETVVALQDDDYFKFARIDCDEHVVLCNIFFAYGAGHLFHLTHTKSPSKSVTPAGMPLVRRTHVRSIPFHPTIATAPIAEKQDADERASADDAASKLAAGGSSGEQQLLESKTSAKPNSEWIIKVVKEELWKEFDEWKSWTHPFHGSGRHAVRGAWWLLYQISAVPPFITLLAITIGGRLIVGRIFSSAPKPAHQQQKQKNGAGGKAVPVPPAPAPGVNT